MTALDPKQAFPLGPSKGRNAQIGAIPLMGWRRRKFDPKTSQAGGAAKKPRTLSRGSFRFRTSRSSPSDSVNLKPPLGEINSNSDNLASIVARDDPRHAIRKRSHQHHRIFSAVDEKTHRVDMAIYEYTYRLLGHKRKAKMLLV
jgi:hypothetical protein